MNIPRGMKVLREFQFFSITQFDGIVKEYPKMKSLTTGKIFATWLRAKEIRLSQPLKNLVF